MLIISHLTNPEKYPMGHVSISDNRGEVSNTSHEAGRDVEKGEETRG